MKKLGNCAFVLAPFCLFISFFSSAVLESNTLRSIFIVLATIFLILAVAGKIAEANRGSKEEHKDD